MEEKEKAAIDYARERLSNDDYPVYNDEYEIMLAFEAGAEWNGTHAWKDAQGKDLPDIDRDVIALVQDQDDAWITKVVFAHRPPNHWDGKNIDTGEVTRYTPNKYGKGGWNIPNVVLWLDVKIPDMGE